jgi:hypothetical protein
MSVGKAFVAIVGLGVGAVLLPGCRELARGLYEGEQWSDPGRDPASPNRPTAALPPTFEDYESFRKGQVSPASGED